MPPVCVSPIDGIPFNLSDKDFERTHRWQHGDDPDRYQNTQYHHVDLLFSPVVRRVWFELPQLNELERNYDYLTFGDRWASWPRTDRWGPGLDGYFEPIQAQPGETGMIETIFDTDYSVATTAGWKLGGVQVECHSDLPGISARAIDANIRYEGVLIGVNDAVYVKFWQQANRRYFVHTFRVSPSGTSCRRRPPRVPFPLATPEPGSPGATAPGSR